MGDQETVDKSVRDCILFATTAASSLEAFVNPVAEEIAQRGHQVHLVTGDRGAKANYPHTSALLPMARGIRFSQDVRALRRWVSHMRALRPKAVVIGTPKASALGMAAARISRVPTRVYVIHGAVWDGATGSRGSVLRAMERTTIANSTHQLAVSRSLARLIVRRGLSESTPDVIGGGSFCGVDTLRFVPKVDGANALNMCFVGRLHRDKGVDVLIRTLDQVSQSVDVQLTVVGGIDTTAPPSDSTIQALRAHPRVNWVGETADVVPYIQRATVLVLPTRREGLPQVVLEAAACGVPVVSWAATGVVDAVRDGDTGLLARYGDEAGLASSVLRLLEDQTTRARMSNRSRALAVSKYERSAVAARNADYIELAISGVVCDAVGSL